MAENQPDYRIKTAMLQGLSDFELRLRAFMPRSLRAPAPEEEFNRLALDLVSIQRQTNPAYAKLCAITPAGQPMNWRQIPPAPTVAFKELELTSLPSDLRQRVFHSSGTTAQKPSRHFHSGVSMALYEESVRLWFEHRFRDRLDGRRLLFLTPPGALAPRSSLAHMFSTIAAESSNGEAAFYGVVHSDGVWSLDFKHLLPALRHAQATGQRIALFGTAFLFVTLLDELARAAETISLPTGSWLLETGGYKGRSRELTRDELHSLIALRLGIPGDFIIAEYGMSELSSQAYDRADGVFHFPPWARAVVVSPENGREVDDGQCGLVRVIDLANVWSVAAIQTEDLAVRAGDGFTLRGRAATAEARGCSLMSAP